MRDPFEPIEKVRMSDVLKVRLLSGFRERVMPAATAEGIGLAEFTRRAIVERVRRFEEAEASASQQPPATSSASQPSRNAQHARAAKTQAARQPASATITERRRDA
jgi:hypothetical protein